MDFVQENGECARVDRYGRRTVMISDANVRFWVVSGWSVAGRHSTRRRSHQLGGKRTAWLPTCARLGIPTCKLVLTQSVSPFFDVLIYVAQTWGDCTATVQHALAGMYPARTKVGSS